MVGVTENGDLRGKRSPFSYNLSFQGTSSSHGKQINNGSTVRWISQIIGASSSSFSEKLHISRFYACRCKLYKLHLGCGHHQGFDLLRKQDLVCPSVNTTFLCLDIVARVVICVPAAGFKLKGGLLDLLPLPTLVAGILDLPYTGSFSVCSSAVMNADSSFNFSSLPPVVSWYNFTDFLHLACKGCGRRSKICCKLVRSTIKFI